MTLRIEDVRYPISLSSYGVGVVTFSDANTGYWDTGSQSSFRGMSDT